MDGEVTDVGPHWGFRSFELGVGMSEPYPLEAHACEGVQFTFTLTFPFEKLHEALESLCGEGEVTFAVRYKRAAWRRTSRKRAKVEVKRRALLRGLCEGSQLGRVDIPKCVVVPWVRGRVSEVLARFELPKDEAELPGEWVLFDDFAACLEGGKLRPRSGHAASGISSAGPHGDDDLLRLGEELAEVVGERKRREIDVAKWLALVDTQS